MQCVAHIKTAAQVLHVLTLFTPQLSPFNFSSGQSIRYILSRNAALITLVLMVIITPSVGETAWPLLQTFFPSRTGDTYPEEALMIQSKFEYFIHSPPTRAIPRSPSFCSPVCWLFAPVRARNWESAFLLCIPGFPNTFGCGEISKPAKQTRLNTKVYMNLAYVVPSAGSVVPDGISSALS